MERRHQFSRREFMKIAGTAALGIIGSCMYYSKEGFTNPLQPSLTDTSIPPQPESSTTNAKNTQVIEQTVEIEKPEETPTPEIASYPLPEDQINPNFSIGPISLEKPFKLIVPKTTSKLAGYGKVLSYDIDPLVVFEDIPPRNTLAVFKDYVNHPKTALIIRSEIPYHNVIYGHSFSNFKKPLLLDWTRRIYRSPEEVIGKSIYIEQITKEKTIKLRLEFIHATNVDDRLFNTASGYYEDDNEPMFIRLDMLGLPNYARMPQQITLVACLETLPGQKLTGSRRYTDNRVVLTAELKQKDIENKS